MGNNPEIIESERGYNPPLGILFIAGYLRDHSNHEVQIIDSQVEGLDYNDLEKRFMAKEFNVVGITTMTLTILDVVDTVKLVKKISPKCKVVLGGPHVHIFPQETITLEGVDFLIKGEGEISFLKLLDALEGRTNIADVPGLVYKNSIGEVIETHAEEMIIDLDALSFPARDLTPYLKYGSLLAKRLPITTIFTSRGCPFRCAFCDRPHLGKKFRAMSAERVVEEFEICIAMGIREFIVYDDTFTVNKQRVIDICRLVIEKGLDIGFDIRARVDTIDEHMLLLLKRAGCRGIHYGVESGTEKILKVLNKGITLKKAKEIFDLTRKHKIETLAYFMIGAPQETRDDIMETFRVIRWLNPDFLHLTILTPFPGTPIYIDGLESGTIKKDYWREFAKNPTRDFIPHFCEEELTRNELSRLLVKGYKQFYCRPSYIIKRFSTIKSFGEFKRKAKAGLKVFFMKVGAYERDS
jgi:radical SAM superfamily enzyme YgiQ (UPF0313 family)